MFTNYTTFEGIDRWSERIKYISLLNQSRKFALQTMHTLDSILPKRKCTIPCQTMDIVKRGLEATCSPVVDNLHCLHIIKEQIIMLKNKDLHVQKTKQIMLKDLVICRCNNIRHELTLWRMQHYWMNSLQKEQRIIILSMEQRNTDSHHSQNITPETPRQIFGTKTRGSQPNLSPKVPLQFLTNTRITV